MKEGKLNLGCGDMLDGDYAKKTFVLGFVLDYAGIDDPTKQIIFLFSSRPGADLCGVVVISGGGLGL